MRSALLGSALLLLACAHGSGLAGVGGDTSDDSSSFAAGMGGKPSTSTEVTTSTSGPSGSGGAPATSGSGGASTTGNGGAGGTGMGGMMGAGGMAVASSTVAASSSVAVASSSAAQSSSSAVASSVASSVAASSSSGGCVQIDAVVDGGFEGGLGAGNWVEQSTNFGTPICDVPGCGMGGGTGPFQGTYWVWIGGIAGAPEDASVSQSVVITPGMATLSFELEIPSCDGFGFDAFDVSIDGNVIYATDDLDPVCGVVGYVQHVIDVTAYADGAPHTLLVEGFTDSLIAPTNFMVDNVSLIVCQ